MFFGKEKEEYFPALALLNLYRYTPDGCTMFFYGTDDPIPWWVQKRRDDIYWTIHHNTPEWMDLNANDQSEIPRDSPGAGVMSDAIIGLLKEIKKKGMVRTVPDLGTDNVWMTIYDSSQDMWKAIHVPKNIYDASKTKCRSRKD